MSLDSKFLSTLKIIVLTHFLKAWFCFPCYLDLKIFKSYKCGLLRLIYIHLLSVLISDSGHF